MQQLIMEITNFYIANFGIFGAFFVIVIGSFFPPVPDSFFFAINFEVFGYIWGFIISYLATIVGASLVYLAFYKLSNLKIFKNFLNKHDKVKFYTKRFRDTKLSTISLALAIPFLPAFAIHIAAGLVKMSYKKFLFGLIIGKVVLVIFWGYVGGSLIKGLTDPIILVWLSLVMIVVYFISKYLSKKYKLEE